METQVYEQWVKDTRAFWDVETTTEAKYRRICSDPEIDACENDAELRRLWQKRTDEELPQLLDGIPIQKNWTCLEIGCGIGRLLAPLAERTERVIGIDVSPSMVEFARDYLKDVPNAEVHLNDGLTLKAVEDESVDWVFSHLAFQHMTLPEVVSSYVSEIRRVLKPGGYCRIQCWREAPLSIKERIKNIARTILGREQYHGPRRWLWSPGREVRFGGITFHPGTWRRMLKEHGLSVTSMELGVGHAYWMWTTSRKT